MFPISSGSLIAGLMFKLGWGSPQLIKMVIGVILKFDDVIGSSDQSASLTEIVLLGQFDLAVQDSENPTKQLLRILVDVRGVYYVQRSELEIDVFLRDSHIAGLPMSGGMAIRASFGGAPNYLLSCGGVHPRFNKPTGFPDLERLSIGIATGSSKVSLGLETYNAVSSNSFQFGVLAQFEATGSGWVLAGHLSFDTLLIFKPRFMFDLAFSFALALEKNGKSIASVSYTHLTLPTKA